MTTSTIISALGSAGSVIAGLLTAAASAGPWGVAAIGLVTVICGVAGFFGWNALVGYFNTKTDARDQANAGADAGNTAVDITNQAVAVRTGLDGLEAANPPVPPPADPATPVPPTTAK